MLTTKKLEHKAIKYAGFPQRLLAHNIDLVPILLLLYLSSFVLPRIGLDWVFFSIIYLAYNVSFEMSRLRATPGKKWMKIFVSSEDGSLKIHQSLIRNLTKSLSLILFFGGFVLILFNARRKALHDYPSKTVVLFDE